MIDGNFIKDGRIVTIVSYFSLLKYTYQILDLDLILWVGLDCFVP